MPLYISTRIEFYNGIARFLCHSTAFLYTMGPQMLGDQSPPSLGDLKKKQFVVA